VVFGLGTLGHMYADLLRFGHVVSSLPFSLDASISFPSAVMMSDKVATWRYMRTLLKILSLKPLKQFIAFSIRNASWFDHSVSPLMLLPIDLFLSSSAFRVVSIQVFSLIQLISCIGKGHWVSRKARLNSKVFKRGYKKTPCNRGRVSIL